MEQVKSDIERFADMLKKSSRTVFFGGAGVSTESGLKDYRSKDGIYHTAREYGRSPEEILSSDCFFGDTELFYRFFRDFFMEKAEPNRTHLALARLERSGMDITVVTQNIDGLHQKAGSSKVFELHGTTSSLHCVSCREKYSHDYLSESSANVPRCRSCGNVIKPDVVLYGEQLDDKVVQGALKAISKADLLIIGGTSLAVYPAAGFVHYFGGEDIVIINRESTPFDSAASLVVHESLGDVFDEAMSLL
ncbi:MAG: NAD-dependent protein deacylase [Clostridia bacterium]|nr:NAD-dependent protein deacylase [Clostridia bacterium]